MTSRLPPQKSNPAAAGWEKRQCYLCQGREVFFRPGSVRDNPELRVCECGNCGLVFLSSFAHVEKAFYAESGMHGSAPLEVEKWLADTAGDDERRFKLLETRITGRTLLDFGCGAGGFLLRARAVAARVCGVELEKRLQMHFLQKGLQVYQNLAEVPAHGDREGFELITLFHVLEHLPDPKAMLQDLAQRLSSEGRLIVEVPHANDALLTLYECEPFQHFTYWSCHLFLFTVQTLEMLAGQSGLKVEFIEQIQRYPLSNHLHWLAMGKPGGHQTWQFLDSPALNSAYGRQLAELGKCDTLLMCLSRK